MTCKRKCNPCRCGSAEGERRKLDAFGLLAAHREAVIRRGQRALLQSLLCSGTATIDEVRDLVTLPKGIDPKCFGTVPGSLARAGIIRGDGFAKTCRPVGHARPVTVWVLLNRDKAERWLADHPDLPDPGDDHQGEAVQAVLFPVHPTNDTGAAVAAAAPVME